MPMIYRVKFCQIKNCTLTKFWRWDVSIIINSLPTLEIHLLLPTAHAENCTQPSYVDSNHTHVLATTQTVRLCKEKSHLHSSDPAMTFSPVGEPTLCRAYLLRTLPEVTSQAESLMTVFEDIGC